MLSACTTCSRKVITRHAAPLIFDRQQTTSEVWTRPWTCALYDSFALSMPMHGTSHAFAFTVSSYPGRSGRKLWPTFSLLSTRTRSVSSATRCSDSCSLNRWRLRYRRCAMRLRSRILHDGTTLTRRIACATRCQALIHTRRWSCWHSANERVQRVQCPCPASTNSHDRSFYRVMASTC